MSVFYKTEKAVVNYINANNSRSKTKVIALFTREATVIDEGICYKGIDEIKMWRRKINAGYQMNLEIMGVSKVSDGIMIDILCTGDFPESPLITICHFITKNDYIASLKISRVVGP